MKNILLSTSLILLLLSCNSSKETGSIEMSEDSERAAIEKVIQNYFEGWLTGDSTLVGSAMHPSCNLKFVNDGKIDRRTRSEYLSGFKLKPRLENAEGRIISIDITRTAAAAKIELEIPKRLFTDYFNLLKEGDRWYITDKVSTSITKE